MEMPEDTIVCNVKVVRDWEQAKDRGTRFGEDYLMARGIVAQRYHSHGSQLEISTATFVRIHDLFKRLLEKSDLCSLSTEFRLCVQLIRKVLIEFNVYVPTHPSQKIFDQDLTHIFRLLYEEGYRYPVSRIASLYDVTDSCIRYHQNRFRREIAEFMKLEPTSENAEPLARGFFSAKFPADCATRIVHNMISVLEVPPKQTDSNIEVLGT